MAGLSYGKPFVEKVGKVSMHYGVQQGTQEWLDLRAGKVTCSNALVLMNKGKKAAIEANRLSAVRLTPNGNAYAERGHVVESEMREKFNSILSSKGLILHECGFITNEDYPDAGYSPDGLICRVLSDGCVDTTRVEGLAEFKAYNDIVPRVVNAGDSTELRFKLVAKHRKACFNILDVPPACIAQCNMAMLLTGADCVFLFLCNPECAQTDALIKKLRDYEQRLSASSNLSDADTERLKEVRAELKNACPNGDYDTPTPMAKVWEIKRNQTICNRLREKLSEEN